MLFVLIIKGLVLGCTAIIPGVSIGSMAIALNVYEKALFGFSVIVSPKQWNKHTILKYTSFFLPIGVGVVVAMFVFANVLGWVLGNYPIFVHISFFGIIVGSLPHIYTHSIKPYISLVSVVYIFIGLALILFFTFADGLFSFSTTANIELEISIKSVLFACMFGIIASACGLIPGISGSFVLLIMGYYSTYLDIINTRTFGLLIPLLIGHVIGFIAVAIGIKSMLTRFPVQSYGIILGMLCGSTIAIFPWGVFQEIQSLVDLSNKIAYVGILALCLGGGILLTKISTWITYTHTPSKTTTSS